ncbi:sigma-54-dependent Fis family transcriptional regulator [Marinobacterium nitratireducens]|uniref:Sigma-54-dependent Fis family transcriptional regulator n=1 Tax=Marinobacterium nitratireducens TaxID=518897 RepID=A0A917ZCN5_9GAMM|nr:sigma-54-dependent Fis family transcriptional regulator [Marinobacterium nitratireducens]GGO79252.1 sigma-54-dependent Fis family transcriptional regulator [Marinobacterium nitratireducens]
MRPNLHPALESDPLNSVRRARESLRSCGEIPEGVLRDEIEASWRRSLCAGLSVRDAFDAGARVAGTRDLLDRHRDLIHHAAPEMEQLARQVGDSGLVVLANSDAVILGTEGCRDKSMRSRYGLIPGACWSEQARGTNALGTAIVDARPTLVNCTEHFLDPVTRFSCTSAPIFDADGGVIGVLDMTREGPLVQPGDSLGIIQLAAHGIENRMFAHRFPDQVVLAFHSRQQYLGSVWHGLMALGLDGRVLALNEQACQLLGRRRESVVGNNVEEVLGEKIETLLSLRLKDGCGSIHTRRGELFCELLQFPRSLPGLRVPAARSGRPARPPCPDLGRLAGGDERLARSLRIGARALAADVPVLLNGETGTGKEVVARALHDASDRAGKPFIAVNCAAIPEGLIESELFGYREGAFTGSRKGGMVGRFQQANGGTLFLDEIGDMPLALQARLLRVLQERVVAPLGGGEEVALDIALICATHHDLRQRVKAGDFREDLFYRLNGVAVRLLSLRERQDLAALAAQLLAGLGADGVELDAEVLRLFESYDWPGNIRQLEMVLKTAVALLEPGERSIGSDHLTDDFLEQLLTPARNHTGSLREAELEQIRATLEQHRGNVSAAAAALGISRATLYRKLRQLENQPGSCGEGA